MTITCPYLYPATPGQVPSCEIISRLAGMIVIPWDNVCEACTNKCSVPQSENYVTASCAIHAHRMEGNTDTVKHLTQKLLYLQTVGLPDADFVAIRAGEGVGTELHRLLSAKGWEMTPDCPCFRHIIKMNSMGPVWCEENIPEIIQWLLDEFHHRYPFPGVKLFDWLIGDKATDLVKQAIANYNSRQSQPQT